MMRAFCRSRADTHHGFRQILGVERRHGLSREYLSSKSVTLPCEGTTVDLGPGRSVG